MATPPKASTRPTRRPTMARIAEKAGTSTPTVSKVLNGGTDVSETTRRRVMAAALELGYERGPRGFSSRSRASTAVVDVVVGHIEGSWIGRVLDGVEEATAAAGVDLVMTRARSDGSWVQRVLRRPSLGVILVLVDTAAAQLHALTAAGLRVVVVDPSSRPPAAIASVGATNWDGGRMAAEHLIGEGHTDIAVVGGSPADLYGSARVDGFTTALRHAGLSIPPERIEYGEWDRARARDAAGRLFDQPGPGPTAIFACSDIMALGVYDAAGERSLRVPEDVSVIGFDDLGEAAWAAPPLTTVQQPIGEMGAAAFRMVTRLGDASKSVGTIAAAPRIELETRLIVRGSTMRRGSTPGE